MGDTQRAVVFCLYQPVDLQLLLPCTAKAQGWISHGPTEFLEQTQCVKWRPAKDSGDVTDQIPGVSANGTTQVTWPLSFPIGSKQCFRSSWTRQVLYWTATCALLSSVQGPTGVKKMSSGEDGTLSAQSRTENKSHTISSNVFRGRI